jgi:CheY-like chemotaxis protein
MPGGGVIEVACENVSSTSSMSMVLPVSGNHVKMSIKDSGVGIPANVLDRVFDPYFSTKQKGSGLGLAISHSIISKHGGHIAVQSSPGVGTTFTVYLPASAQSSEPVKKAEEADVRTRKSRILVMDDEEMVRNILQEMLCRTGHEVLLAKDGIEAVQAYREAMENGDPIDLIIMDLTIPGGIGGKEAVQKILAINPEAKVVVSSGYSNDPVMANFKDYGFCSAIAKPYQLSELTRVISQQVD